MDYRTHLFSLGFCFSHGILASRRRVLQNLGSIWGWSIGANVLQNEILLAGGLFGIKFSEAVIEWSYEMKNWSKSILIFGELDKIGVILIYRILVRFICAALDSGSRF